MDTQVHELVGLIFTKGDLWGARPNTASRTLTVAGKRRIRIRLQVDICTAIQCPGAATPYYPDLSPSITESVAKWREARS